MKTAILTLALSIIAALSSSARTDKAEIDSVTYTLGEIVVKANPRVTSLKGDALHTRVAGTQLEHAGTANDVLTQVPMVLGRAGNGENAKITSTSYMNAKLYKAFCNNRFSVTLEANDIFNKDIRDFTFYNKDVTIFKSSHLTNRTFQLTLQYTFNVTRDRYKGKGAGADEMNRF